MYNNEIELDRAVYYTESIKYEPDIVVYMLLSPLVQIVKHD